MNEERFHVLAEKYLEGRLAEEEARELAQALEASPDLRARLLGEVSMAALLTRTEGARSPDLAPKVLAALRGRGAKEAMVAKVLEALPPRTSRRRIWISGALAAAVLVAVALWALSGPPPSPPPPAAPSAAVLAEFEGEVYLGDARPEAGCGLRYGDRIETGQESAAVVVFHDTSRLRLGAGTEAVLEPLGLALRRGQLSAQVPGVSSGRRVSTAQGEAFGTACRYSVRAEEGATRLEVQDGRASFKRTDDARVEVAAGEYAIALDDRELLLAYPSVDPARVRAAVEKGVSFLRGAPLPSAAWAGPAGSEELVLLALLKAGVPREDPLVGKLLAQILDSKLKATYCVSLQAVVLEALGPSLYRGRIAQCAQFLVDNQCQNGQWSYGEPTPAVPQGPEIRKTRDGPATGNNSCSVFAMLGLRACRDAGITVPRETLERAARGWRDAQRPDPGHPERRGWCYTREETPHHPYGSMSAGGLGSLVLANALLGNDWREDDAFRAGLAWVTYHFTVDENFGPVEDLMAKEMVLSDTPNPQTEFFYYLWALERAAATAGIERFGAHDWYAEGTARLLEAQKPDGSWWSGVRRCQPVWDTCYAILFLTRSTKKLHD